MLLDLEDDVDANAGNTKFVSSAKTAEKNSARAPRRVPSESSTSCPDATGTERTYRSEMYIVV